MFIMTINTGLVPASAEIIQPFVMGCDTKNPKIVQLCLPSVQKLISHEAISVVSIAQCNVIPRLGTIFTLFSKHTWLILFYQ